jgi:hypothetical protein
MTVPEWDKLLECGGKYVRIEMKLNNSKMTEDEKDEIRKKYVAENNEKKGKDPYWKTCGGTKRRQKKSKAKTLKRKNRKL